MSHRNMVTSTPQPLMHQQRGGGSFTPRHRSISPYSRSNPNSSNNSPSSTAYGFPDPNVGAIYPGQKMDSTVSRASPGNSLPPPSSIDRRLAPQQRFTPKHDPVGQKGASESDQELSPMNHGALQFVPAFEESAARTRQPTAAPSPPPTSG